VGSVMSVTYHVGDTRDVTAGLADGSVSLVACSPPFLALRSYLPPDHASKGAEIGAESDPAAFLDTLLGLTAEWGRVLAPWGSIAIELGDTYSGSGGGGGDYLAGGLREGQQQFAGSAASMRESNAAHWRAKNANRSSWPDAKSLALVPQLYAVALAYGINPLTGAVSPAGRWRVRNVIVWHRPNPAVGALGDKFRPSTSYVVVATRDRGRWFDLSAVRGDPRPENARPGLGRFNASASVGHPVSGPRQIDRGVATGAPPLDYWADEYDGHDAWSLTSQPSSLAHYAMWPARLAERLVLSMCPAEVCGTCGEPRRRLERRERTFDPVPGSAARSVAARCGGLFGRAYEVKRETLGWSDCGHGDYRAGVVLDPFAGTGTTLAVADIHGRDAVGIDIDERNRALYPARRAECLRSLMKVAPEVPGQLDLFGSAS